MSLVYRNYLKTLFLKYDLKIWTCYSKSEFLLVIGTIIITRPFETIFILDITLKKLNLF